MTARRPPQEGGHVDWQRASRIIGGQLVRARMERAQERLEESAEGLRTDSLSRGTALIRAERKSPLKIS